MQTILGANGTIGKILAKELPKYTDKIRLVSRNPKKVNESDELFPADLSNPAIVDKAIEGSDVVYLVVGFEYKLSVWQENWPRLMKATINACIKHHARLVFFDNVYSYDISAIPHMTEDSPYNPPSKKGAVRRQIAEMVMDEVKAGRLMALIARAADFYGPDNEKSIVTEMVYKNFSKGMRAGWPVNVNKIHSFTYTPDAGKATALLGNTFDAYNTVWHLPTDKNVLTGKQLIELFSKQMKVANKYFIMPVWLLKLAGIFVPTLKEMPEMMYQFERDYFFDSSKFEKRFKFVPTSYQDGVKETIHLSKH
jgi:nucleoside-diphosphate-sugar epimerase